MTKEEVKQWLRSQIDSSIKTQFKFDKINQYRLCYNNQYVRVLKLSKITGQPVNKNNFKGGELLFDFDTINKTFGYYPKIQNYLEENYSGDYFEQENLLEEVLNEYDEYKDFKSWVDYD